MTHRDFKSGKFVDGKGRHRSRKGSSGRSGPGRLSVLTLAQLSERLVLLEDEHYSITISLGRFPDRVTPLAAKKRVRVMIARARSRQDIKAEALQNLLDRLMIERGSAKFCKRELSRLLSANPETVLSSRMLARSPYAEIIAGTSLDSANRAPTYADRSERVRRHARTTRPLLIDQVLKLESELEALNIERDDRLLSASEGWTPLTRNDLAKSG